MKRIIVFCIAALLLLGCHREASSPVQPAEAPAPSAQASALPERETAESLIDGWEAQGLLEGMYRMEPGDVLDYYGIDLSAFRGGAVFLDAEGYTDELVILEGDRASLDEAQALLEEHLDAVKVQFRGYDPEALALAEKAVLLREGDLLLFVISPRAEQIAAACRSMAADR